MDVMDRRDWLKKAFLGTAFLAVSPYEVLAKQTPNFQKLSGSDPIRLCFNENPFGVSPKAKEAMLSNMGLSSQYGFGALDGLKKKLAAQQSLSPENYLVSAGSSMILEMMGIYTAFLKGNMVYPEPSFTIFSSIGEFLGMNKKIIPVRSSDKKIDLEAMKDAIDSETKLVYLCNPNNPTGDILKREDVTAFIEAVPETAMILIDEAYIEFSGHASLSDLVDHHKNLVISRTFSKLYGLAGARIGYAIAHPETIKQLEKLQSWSGGEISVLTANAALASLDDQKFIGKVLSNNSEAKAYTVAEFKKRGIAYIPSYANFLYFSLADYKGDYFDKLKNAGILGGKTYEEDGKWTRISIGTLDEMKKYMNSVFG